MPLPRVPRQRWGGLVLPILLVIGVFATALGAGYTATRTELGAAIAYLIRGHSVTQVNPESGRVEAEGSTTATGDEELEVDELPGGQISVKNRDTGKTQIHDTGDMRPQGPEIDNAGTPVVLSSGDVAYVLDPGDDIVRTLDAEGAVTSEVRVPGATGTVVPDGGNGIWVLDDGGKVTHVAGGKADQPRALRDPVTTLTVADGRPIAITKSGAAMDIAAEPPHKVQQQAVPGGEGVLATSIKGTGRYIVVLGRDGKLVSVDPRTGARREYDLPRENKLGAPVVLEDRVYVPDYTAHKLHVRDLATDSRLQDVTVPGKNKWFDLTVRHGRVWANDPFDQQSVAIGADGRQQFIDLGPGPGVKTNTNEPTKPTTPEQKPQPPQIPVNPTPPTSPTTTSRPPAPPTIQSSTPQQPPSVVGRRTTPGCDALRSASFVCDPQPMATAAANWSDLDVIAQQDPPVRNNVTVRFWDRKTLPDYTGQNATAICNQIATQSRGDVFCQAVQGTGSGQEGTVARQDPPAGRDVRVKGRVVLTYYPTPTPTPTVPDVVGLSLTDACAKLAPTYRCKGVPDRTARDGNKITDQIPPANTPQQGGEVEVHYSPYETSRLMLLKHHTNNVYILRFGVTSEGEYTVPFPVGYAYRSATPPGSRQLNGFVCTANPATCGGHAPNHYYSASSVPEVPGYQPSPNVAAWLIPSNGGSCAQGQQLISRWRNTLGGQRLYTVSATSPGSSWVNVEDLGCVWT